jgi:hypothetical protein
MDAHEDDVFPNKDFFPDIDNLFGDMSLADDNTNGGSASAPAPTPYVFLIFAFALQFLGLAIDLDMLDTLCSYRSPVNMVSLVSVLSAVFFSLFSWIKSSGKLLIFPTMMSSGDNYEIGEESAEKGTIMANVWSHVLARGGNNGATRKTNQIPF